MDIKIQPIHNALSGSPILYMVNDPLYTEKKFEYIADVTIWQGLYADKPTSPTNELRRPPEFNTGNAVFDVRTLSTDFFTYLPRVFNDSTAVMGMYVWMEVQFGYIYEDSAGDLVIGRDLALSNTITILGGYNYPSDGVNRNTSGHDGASNNSLWLTDRPLISTIPSIVDPTSVTGLQTLQPIWMFLRKDDPLDEVVKIRVEFFFTDNTGEVWEEDLVNNGVIYHAFNAGTEAMITRTLRSFHEFDYYRVYGANAADEEITRVYEFHMEESCAVAIHNLQFLNRFGVWDHALLLGADQEAIDVTRSEMFSSPMQITSDSLDYDLSVGQFRAVNIHARETHKINTGWIREGANELIRQFMLSALVFDANTRIPYVLKNTNIQFLTERRSKLINYEVDLEVAYTSINTVE